ncbi:hypothetical protein [Streptomyces sp. RLB3-6]|uniref:hypothetical protein n=1 Tax=Streptomyces sp. RLB3-6 TaxID=2594457 RepID=UPI001162CCC8|nr:hypothetical protein [Streptomyces sp. RLB3-6]QDN84357.1 hypothetical protein FNV61_00065 [Streptomyces sp. RLB3-6]
MTEIQQLSTTPDDSRGIKALRRTTTHVLRLVGDYVGIGTVAVASLGVVGYIANAVAGVVPAFDQVTVAGLIVVILATWGGAQLIELVSYGTAAAIDPDAKDGDDLWDAAKVLRANAADISQGVDYDDVRLGLQASNVLPALYVLTTALRNEYASDGEMEEASAISDTAALLRAAAESFGHKDVESFGQQAA